MSPEDPSAERASGPASGGPLFTILIATWMRAGVIRRCVDSVLAQDFDDYEVIVVEEHSRDGTVELIRAYRDPRVKLIEEEENRGVWGARRVGLADSRGAWIVLLDSDDELAEGALRRLADRVRAAPQDVGIIGASYEMDTGQVQPAPPLPGGLLGLVEYLAWLDVQVRSDYLHVVRRKVFETVELPPPRWQGNLFELEVFDHWRKDISRDICGIVHTDQANRLLGRARGFSRRQLTARAEQGAAVTDRLLGRYGPMLRTHAPRWHDTTHRQAGLMHMLAGHRAAGARHMAAYLSRRPSDVKAWAVLVLGLLGPGVLLWVRRNLPR